MITLLSLALAGDAPTRRVALVAGANDGGPDRVRLRYATADARAMADVLVELGGVARSDVVMLADPSVDGFRAALAGLTEAPGPARRVEVVLYYSGHSDGEGLLLGGERYRYQTLREDLDALRADVRIAVLDSCASGALVLRKGGAPVPAFLVDTSSQVAGHAFLTSSSADEVSQEAGRIGGSFFTHALVSGLRGAADADQDKRVTLQEAYDFAHAETLSRTESTQRGTQHPQYELDLTGTGDLVLTDLASTTSGLRLPEDLAGRVHVWAPDGSLAAELFKPAGRLLEIGLAPGRYRIVVEADPDPLEGRLDLVHGQLALLDVDALRPVRRTPTVARGGAVAERPVVVQHWPVPRDQGFRDHAAMGLVTGSARLDGLALGLFGSAYSGDVTGVQLAFGTASARGRVRGWQGGFVYNGAGTLAGLQTGVVNSADAMDGVQLGAINRAGALDGVAVGFVNVADTGRGLPIGLVNLVRDGIFDVEVWSSDLSLVNVGLKSGTRSWFTSVILGYDPGDAVGLSSAGGSLGIRPLWRGPFTVDLDVTALAHFPSFLHGEQVVVVPALRAQVGADVHPRLGVFAGVSLGGHASLQAPDARVTGMPTLRIPTNGGGLQVHPGWFAGLRF
ncbi:MAG: caspase family protein [Myxococcales bacterium]|nr:caspase family protein [Myxococcales bacterium]MCB9671574.1 caspase family protein [Alphaproteobacteria bacterium]MCB9691836.1 caspase family protein [Alphaproteobacteria bacterium]